MQLAYGFNVDPASDDDVQSIREACREYLADIARGGVGPDPKNVYQESLLRFLGEQMPAVLARLQAAERAPRQSRVA